ncbi:MAG: HEAT repeat domain-containing protein [Planctomycetota bacterium]|jgi:HEAT repeat protein
MPESESSTPPAAYALLPDVPNLAVETALLEALPDLEANEQCAALDALVARRRDRGLRQLVGNFAGFDAGLQDRILARTRGLYAGARLAMADENLDVRTGAIEFIRRSGDCRLAYLLAGALRQPCPKTRERAGEAIHDVTEHYLTRRATAAEQAAIEPDLQSEGRYLAGALRQAVESWDMHFRPAVLTAAMWMAEEVEDDLLAEAAAPRSKLPRGLLERLYVPEDGRLAAFALRALQSPPLRVEAARTIEAARHADFVTGLISESWVLADPRIALPCLRIRRLNWLDEGAPALTDLPPVQVEGAVRLIAASGMPSDNKVRLYAQLLAEADSNGRRAAFWKLIDVRTEAANCLLRELAQHRDDPLSPAAAAELDRRGCTSEVTSPGRFDALDQDALSSALIPAGDQPLEFEEFWRAFDSLDDSSREPAGEAARRECPDLADRLRAKLVAGETSDRVKALRMVRELEFTRQVEEQIYRLANDADSVVRSLATALLIDLDGPTTRRILRRALDDPDARVQANAIEALDYIELPQRDRDLVPKLDAPHQRVRATAVAALLKMQVPEAAEALLEMLEAPSRAQRISALWVVEHLQLASLVHRLADLSQNDPDPQVRRRAGRVLAAVPVRPTPVTHDPAIRQGV